jgi:hypothetical protein
MWMSDCGICRRCCGRLSDEAADDLLLACRRFRGRQPAFHFHHFEPELRKHILPRAFFLLGEHLVFISQTLKTQTEVIGFFRPAF